jgi:hypothetical protein
MGTGTRIVALVVAGVASVLLVVILINHFDPPAVRSREFGAQLNDAERAALAPDWTQTKRLWIQGAGVGGLIVIIGVSLGIAGLSIRHPLLVNDRDGVFPGTIGVKVHAPVGNHQAHVVKAGVSGPQRLPAATYKQLTRPPDDPLQLPAPSVNVELVPYEVLKPDLANYPVRLIVGRSGCGKTNLGHALLGVARQELPGAEFVICSLVAHRWPGILSANTTDGILAAAEAVHAELLRRDAYLAQHKFVNAQASDLRPLMFVMDEAQSVFDEMDAAMASRFETAIKAIVNYGRNMLVASVFLTQTGDRKIMPKTLNDNADVLIGNSHDWVAAAFAITNEALRRELNGAPQGRFYSLRHGAWCTFPLVKVPQVRLSSIYQAPLQLAADAEADGLGAADQPDGATASAALPLLPTDAEGGVWDPAGVGRRPVGSRDYTLAIDEAFEQRVWEVWDGLEKPNYTAVQKLMFPDQEDGGAHWKAIKAVVLARREAQRQQHRRQYLEVQA